MPETKTAREVAKRHPNPKHTEAKDLRRAYEHLGRVQVLQQSSESGKPNDIHALVRLAEQQLEQGHRKDAADLLRAAEHFSFAVLAGTELKPAEASPELVEAIHRELEHLTRRAHEHWDEHDAAEHHSSLAALFQNSLHNAVTASHAGRYRQALELARGAEALAHVRRHGAGKLSASRPFPSLARP